MSTVKVLHRSVYFDEKINPQATDFELLQYGAALVAIGANNEGLKILKLVSNEVEPEKNLNISIALFYKWKYREALPYLEEYIRDPRLTEYQMLIGNVNLASCYIGTKNFQKAYDLAQEVLQLSEVQGLRLLSGFALEIISESLIWMGKHKECEASIILAEEALAQSGSTGFIWLQKWSAVNQLFQGDIHGGLEKLAQVRKTSFEKNEWETVRECDLFLSKFGQEPELFHKVYFGSPLEEYKMRAYQIYSESKKSVYIPQYFDWQPNPVVSKTKAQSILFDWQKMSKSLYQLFILLCEDFYKPVRIAQVHESLFPDQIFHPIHSVRKTYDLIRRLKNEIKPYGLEIIPNGSGYFLRNNSNCSIRKKINQEYFGQNEEIFKEIMQIKRNASFCTDDLVVHLGLSRTTAHRFLKWALESKKISRQGSGKRTVYLPIAHHFSGQSA